MKWSVTILRPHSAFYLVWFITKNAMPAQARKQELINWQCKEHHLINQMQFLTLNAASNTFDPGAAALTKMPAMYPEGNETELARREIEKQVLN